MATRAIVTSQPEVACDICARRLLRGEQPETFVADGRRTVVCELCTPRARSAGWVHVSEARVIGNPPEERPGQGGALRGLVRRWRGGSREQAPSGAWDELDGVDGTIPIAPTAAGAQYGDAAGYDAPDYPLASTGTAEPITSEEEMWAFEDAALGSAGSAAVGDEASEPPRPAAEPDPSASAEGPATTTTATTTGRSASPVRARRRRLAKRDSDDAEAQPAMAGSASENGEAPMGSAQAPTADEPAGAGGSAAGGLLAEAIALFNATEGPRRIAGVARSLGAPVVTVRQMQSAGSADAPDEAPTTAASGEMRVAIVVAWELCWYRWEVDVNGVAIDARLVAQGSELDELPSADLDANAAVDKRGAVQLL